MNKKQRKELEDKIASVEETILILKHQESNLLQAIAYHKYDHNEEVMKQWVKDLLIGCEYILRLQASVELIKKSLPPRRKNGGKKKD